MRAIILAAGMGTRLGTYTKDLPKGMLNFHGKPLLRWQIDALQAAGVSDITIVRGYEPDKIQFNEVLYRENPEFQTTNMAASLMSAEDVLISAPDGVVVCYADIIYEPRLIECLLTGASDVTVLADSNWVDYWKARLDVWEEDIESLQFDSANRIIEIGTPRCPLSQAQARYIGLIKFSQHGAQEFVRAFHENREEHWHSNTPWRRSKSFQLAYMTCMLQELVDRNLDVRVQLVQHGWMEFDTVEDYEKAQTWVKENSLSRFISLDAFPH